MFKHDEEKNGKAQQKGPPYGGLKWKGLLFFDL
jgi:hypothetical protein